MNVILATDSYKLTHFNQYPADTEVVYSYLEARPGAEYDETVFFGLQSGLLPLCGEVVTQEKLEIATMLAETHMGSPALFNRAGWQHIIDEHEGRLPLRIKAVPEGTPVKTGNVLMTVENTDPKCYWLTNALESYLLHVWYPTTVASRSRAVKQDIAQALITAGSPLDGIDFMLHDFGYRGATTHDAAAIGGAGHLVNFKGTDTLPAMELAMEVYQADPETLAFSVPATEHSVMTALGREGEFDVVDRLLDNHPGGILSVVADSYNIYEFVNRICTPEYVKRIKSRDGVFVVRPDSVTPEDPTPAELVVTILENLEDAYGSTRTERGYHVLDPHVRVLWGDGIDHAGIKEIMNSALNSGFSPENLVFGMGGGLLQKLNRDTQRFAFKSSAQRRGGVWYDVFKEPLDSTKNSKRGRLKLSLDGWGEFETRRLESHVRENGHDDLLQTVFENGELLIRQEFEDIRRRASI